MFAYVRTRALELSLMFGEDVEEHGSKCEVDSPYCIRDFDVYGKSA